MVLFDSHTKLDLSYIVTLHLFKFLVDHTLICEIAFRSCLKIFIGK